MRRVNGFPCANNQRSLALVFGVTRNAACISVFLQVGGGGGRVEISREKILIKITSNFQSD